MLAGRWRRKQRGNSPIEDAALFQTLLKKRLGEKKEKGVKRLLREEVEEEEREFFTR